MMVPAVKEAVVCLILAIPGAFETSHVYVCRECAEDYEHELKPWIYKSRRIGHLHVDCNRCAQKR